jgi:hypothetical protein
MWYPPAGLRVKIVLHSAHVDLAQSGYANILQKTSLDLALCRHSLSSALRAEGRFDEAAPICIPRYSSGRAPWLSTADAIAAAMSLVCRITGRVKRR